MKEDSNILHSHLALELGLEVSKSTNKSELAQYLRKHIIVHQHVHIDFRALYMSKFSKLEMVCTFVPTSVPSAVSIQVPHYQVILHNLDWHFALLPGQPWRIPNTGQSHHQERIGFCRYEGYGIKVTPCGSSVMIDPTTL